MKHKLKDLWVNVLCFSETTPSIYGDVFTERSEAISDRPAQIVIAKEDHGVPKYIIVSSMKTMTLDDYETIIMQNT